MRYNIFWVISISVLFYLTAFTHKNIISMSILILVFFIISILNMTVVKCKTCNLVMGYWGEPTTFISFFTNKCEKCMGKEKTK